MKKIYLIVAVLLAMTCTTSILQAQTTQKIAVPSDLEKWITTTFAKGKTPPFSFIYNDRPSSEFIRKWKHSTTKLTSDDPNVIKYQFSYTDPASGLTAVCLVDGFPEFNAVEWVLNFRNGSDKNSAQLKAVNVVDLTWKSETEGDFNLLRLRGSCGSRADFQPILSTLTVQDSVYMFPDGGRSSDNSAFPFFNIETPDQKGVVVGIGWTGTWFADVRRTAGQEVSLTSGMKYMDLFLYPEEQIRTPCICLLFWEGENLLTGNNHFRRFMLAHNSRKIDGKFAEYPLSAGFEWGDPAPCNEYSCLTEELAIAMIQRYKQFGITPEVFWLDAGWYTGCGGPDFTGGNWSTNVGNWTVDTTRFPDGLKPISDAAHRVGAKFMVWFEPERVDRSTLFARLHPEWMLKRPNDNCYLFNLGDKEACAWLSKYIGDMIEENGIDYYRQDFNMPTAPYWAVNEEPGRTGINEIRHVEGLYAYWDYLLERFPNLLIDNCASGGRRLDLETMKRSAPLWRTDYQYGEVNGYQCHTYGLNLFLPLHGTGIYNTDDYSFRSCLGSTMVINWEIFSIRGSIPDMQRVIAEYKELKPYFYEDYYPLTGYGDQTGDDAFLAYQLNRPSDRSGIVVAFRRKDNATNNIQVKLQGLDPETVYAIQNDNDGSITRQTGRELAEGVTLSIDQAPGSLLLRYTSAEK